MLAVVVSRLEILLAARETEGLRVFSPSQNSRSHFLRSVFLTFEKSNLLNLDQIYKENINIYNTNKFNIFYKSNHLKKLIITATNNDTY